MTHEHDTPTAARIEWRGVTRRFRRIVAVDDVSLQVGAGEIVALIGRNGAGKSTLLRLAAGMLRPDAGFTFVEGLVQEPRNIASRRSLGYVPDNPTLFGHLTAIEHLAFLAQVHRLDDWRARADRLFQALDLGSDARLVVSGLALGMQQRVSLACALLHDPRVLLLDEPLNALDPLVRRRVQDEITRRAREGAAVIVSSHQLEALGAVATRVVVMERGRTVLDESASGGTTLEESLRRVTGEP